MYVQTDIYKIVIHGNENLPKKYKHFTRISVTCRTLMDKICENALLKGNVFQSRHMLYKNTNKENQDKNLNFFISIWELWLFFKFWHWCKV